MAKFPLSRLLKYIMKFNLMQYCRYCATSLCVKGLSQVTGRSFILFWVFIYGAASKLLIGWTS